MTREKTEILERAVASVSLGQLCDSPCVKQDNYNHTVINVQLETLTRVW